MQCCFMRTLYFYTYSRIGEALWGSRETLVKTVCFEIQYEFERFLKSAYFQSFS